jgi:hypothetical protein
LTEIHLCNVIYICSCQEILRQRATAAAGRRAHHRRAGAAAGLPLPARSVRAARRGPAGGRRQDAAPAVSLRPEVTTPRRAPHARGGIEAPCRQSTSGWQRLGSPRRLNNTHDLSPSGGRAAPRCTRRARAAACTPRRRTCARPRWWPSARRSSPRASRRTRRRCGRYGGGRRSWDRAEQGLPEIPLRLYNLASPLSPEIEQNKDWLRFPYDSTVWRAHYLHPHPHPHDSAQPLHTTASGGCNPCRRSAL